MARPMSGPLAILLALGAGALVVACEEKKSVSPSPRPDASAGTDKYATADPRLARALQAAASASATADNGPPPEGIFAPGAADQRHARGVPTKVDVVSEGAEPRVSLGPAADASPDAALSSSYGPAAFRLGEQRGRVARPTVDLAIVLGPAKKDDGGSDWLVGQVKKASPAHQQMGQLPPGMDKEIGSLEGTVLRVRVTPDGRASEAQAQLGKGTRPELEALAQDAAEALFFATVPLPPKPVGIGGQWIAETRMPFAGLDAIVYRAFRVKSATGDRVHLTLDVKAYAASKNVDVQGVPKGAAFSQFDAEAQGEMEVVRGEPLARMSDLQEHVMMMFQAPGAPPAEGQGPGPSGQPAGNLMAMQIQSQATLARGDDLRAAMKAGAP